MFFRLWIFFLLQLVNPSFADHYKGGTLSWKPVNPYSISGPTVEVTITERHSWTFSRYPCNLTTIDFFGVYNDTQGVAPATLTCISDPATCNASLYQTINSPLYCTDYSTVFEISSGTYYTTQYLAINSVIDIAWRGASWANETLTNQWSLVTYMNLTPISTSGKINTSPVTGSIPIFQTYIGDLTVIQIVVGDYDNDQIVRCRWSNQLPVDECGNICMDLTSATLSPTDCAITWTAVLRAEDIANGLTASTYVAAITAEDFTNTTSTTALSSVPHQVLVYVSYKPAAACGTKPSISGFSRRNLACYAVSVGSWITYYFQSTIDFSDPLCINNTIIDFISSSPLFINRSELYQVSNYTWGINVTWIVNTNQTGLQPFCIASVDNHGQTSTQYCQMIVVGGTNPTLYTPTFVQGTASPVGTVMITQQRFSIQANFPLRRTTINGTYILIRRLDTNAIIYQIDTKYSPDVYFLNTTLVFFVTSPPWILGVTYYIEMPQGVATADIYCGLEDDGLYGINNWRFTIWNPSASSTTTPSTTTSTATTHTVTTRGQGTTTYNTLYTTTGLPAYTTSTTTSTTSTTSTSATTTTTTSATTTTTTTTTTTQYVPNANVIYPKDFELACLQPVTVATALITIAFIPLHLFAMINLFVKMNSNFQKQILRNRSAHRHRLPSLLDFDEEETFV